MQLFLYFISQGTNGRGEYTAQVLGKPSPEREDYLGIRLRDPASGTRQGLGWGGCGPSLRVGSSMPKPNLVITVIFLPKGKSLRPHRETLSAFCSTFALLQNFDIINHQREYATSKMIFFMSFHLPTEILAWTQITPHNQSAMKPRQWSPELLPVYKAVRIP